MAHNYISSNRDQPFLIAPDMRDWLGPNHLAWFILECVEGFDTSSLHAKHPNVGVGRPPYNPDVLLALMLYGYCTGTRSSRQIEKLCEVDVAYRVITANKQPDHSTIARFRKEFCGEAAELFLDVLRVAKEQNALDLGVVALDGTKMAANASGKNNRSRSQLEDLVQKMFDEADEIDAEEDKLYGDKRGDELPEGLTDPKKRKAAIERIAKRAKAAKDKLDDREESASETTAVRELEQAVKNETRRRHELEAAALADEKRREHRAQGRRGAPLNPLGSIQFRNAQTALDNAIARREKWAERYAKERKSKRANITDCDSRMMLSAKGWVQGYNAQAIVDAGGIIVAADIWDNPTDPGAFEPMMHHMLDNLALTNIKESVGTLLADAGYFSVHNVSTPGPDRLIADTKACKVKKETTVERTKIGNQKLDDHRERLRSPEGKVLYSNRQHMIEPVFGHTKFNRGFKHFLMRGMQAAKAEWNLMMSAHNLTKLHAKRVMA